LALAPGTYSPFLHESLARLGTWLPFERVPAALQHFTRVPVSAETARRHTEAAGAALAAAETAAVAALEQTTALPPAPPGRWQVSVDGAMVPVVPDEWAEVKTLAIGQVVERSGRGGPTLHTEALSYFSRLAEADTFRRLAWCETHRRGVTAAPDACGLVDGAEWCQGFLAWHCPQAVRILDFPHAGEYLAVAARPVFGADTPVLVAWLDRWLHELEYGDPDAVLREVAALPRVPVGTGSSVEYPRDTALQYLTKRREQIAYAAFRAAGYPIGSGAVESANKLVVEARLKGSGMHWARANVNPMLALRGAACSDRWGEAWAQLTHQHQQQRAAARAQRAAAHRVAPEPAPSPPSDPERPLRPRRKGTMVDGRPTRAHPWHGRFPEPSDQTPLAAKC
jgi:hypothetical protein